MARGSDGVRRVLAVVVHQWPSLLFVPAVVVLLLVLIGVTRAWDRRDRVRLADQVAGPRGATPAPPRGSGVRRRWWPQPRCRCSWHTGRLGPARAVATSARRGTAG
jgi:hypothetical protein